MSGWALDLGTTNSAIATWSEADGRPFVVELPALARRPEHGDKLEAPPVIPSVVEVVEHPSLSARMSTWPLFRKRALWGRLAYIGQEALDRNEGMRRPTFAETFKPYLGQAPLRTLARVGRTPVSARDVARLFARELVAEVKRAQGVRLRELVVTIPVDAFENYRAELASIFTGLGIKKLRFLDEPVAAAIGYGVGRDRDRQVLVVDFGGGTLDLALVRTGGRSALEGSCNVVAKSGRAIGGALIDRMLLEHICAQLDMDLGRRANEPGFAPWLDFMRNEARLVKERLYLNPVQRFDMVPPEELRRFEARLNGEAEPVEVTRNDLTQMLEQRGVYAELEACLADVEEQARQTGMKLDDIDDVLMVGGSTLLPRVYQIFEQRFGRAKVRAWQPFEAVAYGAATFAAGHQLQGDFIVHDYAFVVHDLKTNERQYTVVVPRGTRYPTPNDLWQRTLVPTCPLGEPEHLFKLVVCELGEHRGDERRFAWDLEGGLHKLGGRDDDGQGPLVVPLNERDPVLGRLDPAHPPGDVRPRLKIAFGVNSERWLVASVTDLWSHKVLMNERPVVQLL